MSEPDDVDVQAIHRPVLRERAEPTEGTEPIPVWMGAIFVALIAWGGWYLGRHDASFDPARADMRGATAAKAVVAADRPLDAAPVEDPDLGPGVYQSRCAACHQGHGNGMPGLAPPLVGSDWVTGDAERIVRIVLHGLTGPIEVNGQTWDATMPAWGRSMSDAEIAAVLTHVRRTWGNDAPPVPVDEVARIRAAHPDRSTPWTAPEL